MNRIDTKLEGVCILEPEVFGDHRGWFMETYSTKVLHELGIDAVFVQDNQSYTKEKGTLRGIHFQNGPMAQAKLVRVIRGAVLDVAVDLRKGSPTYRQWVGVELSADNRRMLYIPRGFGHGFVTLTDDVEFVYKVDNLYSREQWGLLSGLFCVFPEEKYKNIWRAEGFPGWRTVRTRTFLTPGTGSGRQLSRKWRRSIPGQWSI